MVTRKIKHLEKCFRAVDVLRLCRGRKNVLFYVHVTTVLGSSGEQDVVSRPWPWSQDRKFRACFFEELSLEVYGLCLGLRPTVLIFAVCNSSLFSTGTSRFSFELQLSSFRHHVITSSTLNLRLTSPSFVLGIIS